MNTQTERITFWKGLYKKLCPHHTLENVMRTEADLIAKKARHQEAFHALAFCNKRAQEAWDDFDAVDDYWSDPYEVAAVVAEKDQAVEDYKSQEKFCDDLEAEVKVALTTYDNASKAYLYILEEEYRVVEADNNAAQVVFEERCARAKLALKTAFEFQGTSEFDVKMGEFQVLYKEHIAAHLHNCAMNTAKWTVWNKLQKTRLARSRLIV